MPTDPEWDDHHEPGGDASSRPTRLGPVRSAASRLCQLDDAALESDQATTGDPVRLVGQFTVDFVFEPDPRLGWSFRVREEDLAQAHAVEMSSSLSWTSADGSKRLRLLVTRQRPTLGDESAVEFSGIAESEPLSDSAGRAVEEVRFDVINLNAPFGTVRVSKGEGSWSLARHEWECAGWRVVMDGQPDVDWKELKARAGYQVTHVGSLTRADGGSFPFADAIEFIGCLHWLLSLVQGRRVGIALPAGFARRQGAYSDCTPVIDMWSVLVTEAAGSGVASWYPKLEMGSLGGLLEAFCTQWDAGDDERDYLRFLVAIYCTATAQAILVEPRFVMAYVGLEAIAGEDVPEGQAVNVAVCLERVLERYCILTDAEHLGNPLQLSPVRHLVAVRTAIVHSNQKRMKDDGWSQGQHVVHAWQVALWMLEVLLLKKLGYSGKYDNRLTRTTEQLPHSNPG